VEARGSVVVKARGSVVVKALRYKRKGAGSRPDEVYLLVDGCLLGHLMVDGCLLGLYSFPEDLESTFPGDAGEILTDNTASKMTHLIVSALRISH
jgi:hypothetical protein